MRLRLKLFFLLLVIALVPLLFMGWYSQSRTLALGESIAARARSVLTDLAEEKLAGLARDYSRHMRGESDYFGLAIRTQARAIEALLGEPPDPAASIVFATDFDRGTDLPADVEESGERYSRVHEDGTREPLELSRSTTAIWLAPGVRREDVEGDIARLAGAVPIYRRLLESHDLAIHWQYTSLASGVHSTYPAHGGYPADFDPRTRSWYLRALRDRHSGWNLPLVDASTRQPMLTISEPVFHPDGTLAGVTGIDLRLLDVLQEVQLPSAWRDGGRALVVVRPQPHTGLPPGIHVVAEADYLDVEPRWDREIEMDRIEEESEGYRRLLAKLEARETGVLRMPHRGRDCLWGHGPLDPGIVDLLLIVPYDLVVEEAEAVEQVVLGAWREQLAAIGAAFVIVVGAVLVLAIRGSRKVTEPVLSLAAAAERIASGDLEARAHVRTRDEIGDLAHAFNAMVPALRERLRMRDALQLAMEVQQNLLPKRPPILDGFDISGTSIYCDETGGDYYDYLELEAQGPGRLGVVVGDVTGHGVAPALLMATARALLRSRAHSMDDLAALLGAVNGDLAADSDGGRFMTLFYLVIDAEEHRYRWVGAGHDPALVYDPEADEFTELTGRDIPLGIEGDWTFHEFSREGFKNGEIVLLGTDGIWETRDAAGEHFGKERIREIVRANARAGARAIQDSLTAALASHRGPHPQEDDVTLVIVRACDA